MASLFKRGNGYYASFFDATKRPKRKQVALGTKIKREAERKLYDLEDRYSCGTFNPWNPTLPEPEADLSTLGGAVKAFIDSKV